jgi:hypothetical protein
MNELAKKTSYRFIGLAHTRSTARRILITFNNKKSISRECLYAYNFFFFEINIQGLCEILLFAKKNLNAHRERTRSKRVIRACYLSALRDAVEILEIIFFFPREIFQSAKKENKIVRNDF